MSDRYRLCWLIAGPLFCLFACSDPDPTPPEFDQVATQALTGDYANGAAYAVNVLAQGVNFGFPDVYTTEGPSAAAPLLPAGSRAFGGHLPQLAELGAQDLGAIARAGVAEGCTVFSRGFDMYGSPVDVNQNGIADNAYVRVECLRTDSTSTPDTTFHFYSYDEVSAQENFHSLHGLTTWRIDRSRLWNNFEELSSGSASSSGTLDVEPGGVTMQARFTETTTTGSTGADGDRALGVSWSATFTPDQPITAGGPLPDGTLSATGTRWDTEQGGPRVSWTMTTRNPLRYLAICASVGTSPPFTGGTVEGLLNGRRDQARFAVTFPACGHFNTTTDGTTGFAGP